MTKVTIDKALIEQAIESLDFFASEMTVGQRYTNQGQDALDLPDKFRAALAEPESAQQEPADWNHFPKSNTGVAADAIDAVLSERNYPASPAAAARCGWEAAHRLLKSMLAESAAEVPLLTAAEILAIMRGGNNCNYNDEGEHVDFARAVEQAVIKKAGIK